MNERLDEAGLAAVAAAYAIVVRAGADAALPAVLPGWRAAARVELADRSDVRRAVRRSLWRAAVAP